MSSRLVPTPELLQDAKNFKGEFLVRIFGAFPQIVGASLLSGIPNNSNIVGVGYGVKISGDTVIDDLALRVYVRSKLPKSQIPNNEQVPDVSLPLYPSLSLALSLKCLWVSGKCR